MHGRKYWSGLAAIVTFAAALGTTAVAQGHHVAPVVVEATTTCPEGYRSITRFDPAYSSSKAGVTQTRSADATAMSFSSTVPVDAVIVKGGEKANLYTYAVDTYADTDLRAPLSKYGTANRISWVEYCTNNVPSIDFTIVKTGVETTAVAGTTVNFAITVKNTGNTSFSTYTFDDPGCVERRTGANSGDKTFDPGDTWTYSCSMPTAATASEACNTATLTGANSQGMTAGPKSSKACIPLTPPPGAGPPPAGDVLPDTVVSGQARLRGASGCVKQAFRARVRGRSIAAVSFFVDGKRVKRLVGERPVYSVKIRPKRYGSGRHRIVARVRFTAESRTAARRLSLTFRRCAKQTVTPRFTG